MCLKKLLIVEEGYFYIMFLDLMKLLEVRCKDLNFEEGIKSFRV